MDTDVNDLPHGLKGMYEDYFLDYASYVILERAVPAIEDGLKPVQRRILHAMKEMDDGRFHKVANIIGQTMQYHPHGDQAIGDALVNLGQKNLLVETQGNWGDTRTGDSAAAPRYIEARLSKFALEVGFNKQITDWRLSYDGRKNEPVYLPMKFPLLLAIGVEGIAVGLSTKIMPHNFIELLEASINILKEKSFKLYPDFDTGGYMDVSEYNKGKRGGKIKVRAHIEHIDKKYLKVTELPYGVTTSSLIDSIIKANDKGKIKIKHVTDNTAAEVEVLIELGAGVSPQVMEDALYAFTNCEVSISPNACAILNNKPLFLTVDEILKFSTDQTVDYLKQELEIKRDELLEKWHFASLEKIFIEKRIYRDIEEAENWQEVIEAVEFGLYKYITTPSNPESSATSKPILELMRDITVEDIERLTEIKIKKISKYNVFAAEEKISNIEEELKETNHHLAHLTQFAIDYFQMLIDKYGEGRERKTKITKFDQIDKSDVIVNNAKLYVNKKAGFIGTGLKKDEFVADCSDLDDVIVFKKDGNYQVVRVDEKVYVGKNILHVAVWKKGDDRTTYNAIYTDGKSGRTYAKRFNVKAITRDRDYNLMTDDSKSKLLYFSANPNGEAEVVKVLLTQSCKARIKKFEYDFKDLDIKGRNSKGNTVTKYPVLKVTLHEEGESTLDAIDVWVDKVSGRMNTDERGKYIGKFHSGDQILTINNKGQYELTDMDFEFIRKYDIDKLLYIGKFNESVIITAMYYEGERKWTLLKRFNIETTTTDQKFDFLTEHRSTDLIHVSVASHPIFHYKYKSKDEVFEESIDVTEFIDIKGWKSLGNKLSEYKVKFVKEEQSESAVDEINLGDTIELDIENEQGTLFD